MAASRDVYLAEFARRTDATPDVGPTMNSVVVRAIAKSSPRRAPARARTATLCGTLIANRAKGFRLAACATIHC